MPPLTSGALLQHLWKAAGLLRNLVAPSKSRSYLLGLLLLKRLSDRFEEETADLIAKGVEEEVAQTDPDEHQFMIPEQARWSAIQRARYVGEALDGACAALANTNPTLGFLRELDFNDSRAFLDGRLRGNLLQDLVHHFSALSLRSADLHAPEELALVSELLLDRFARDEAKRGGASRTPRQVTELVVQLLDPRPGMRICDPACGTGGMLVRCATYVAQRGERRLGADLVDVTLHGQEVNREAWTLCKLNMVVSGLSDARIEHGDTLREPKLTRRDGLMVYDRVLANPPFNLTNWGNEQAEHDPFGRFRHGLPPRQWGDYAFVQHVLAVLAPTGVAGVVVSHGTLFRGGAEGAIRKRIIDEDVVEAIVGLPANLFYGTPMPAAILLLNRAKPEARKRRILFVDASAGFESHGHQNELRPLDVERIVAAIRGYDDVERFCRVVPLDEIAANDHALTIPRYVDTRERAEPLDIDDELITLRRLEAARDAAAARMDELLRDLGHGT